MAASATGVQQLLPFPKTHDFLAIAAFLGLCSGLTTLAFKAVQDHVRPRLKSGANTNRFAACVAGAPLLPIAAAGLSQLYISFARPDLPWVSIAWRAAGEPLYLSFAFWEWTMAAVLSGYVVALSSAPLSPVYADV